MAKEDQAAFLKQARELDGTVLGAIHDQYYPVVYRYLRYRMEDPQLVEDLTSEVFMRLLDALKRQRGPLDDLRGWLLGTASHLVQDHLRLKYRRQEDDLQEHEHIPGSEHIEHQVEQREEEQRVRSAMKNLTAEQQHVLALRFSQELSLEETARMMGKSVNAVKVLQFRAVEALRRQLK